MIEGEKVQTRMGSSFMGSIVQNEGDGEVVFQDINDEITDLVKRSRLA